jgi:hypothetical protein
MTSPKKVLKVHCTPGVDARAAARDFRKSGAVAIDDIGENLYDVIRDEIFEELGHAADFCDIRTDRIVLSSGPVFVFRDAATWSAAEARRAVLSAFPQA